MAPEDGLTVEEAERLVFQRTQRVSGQFYGPAGNEVSLGVGLFYAGLVVPLYDALDNAFKAVGVRVLVLTHECDIDADNAKAFNSDVLVVPVAPFEHVFAELKRQRNDNEIRGYLGDLSEGRISQLMYLPPLPGCWERGAVIYFNRITHTHVLEFDGPGVQKLCAFSGYAFTLLHERLSHHLLRAKADPLPLIGRR